MADANPVEVDKLHLRDLASPATADRRLIVQDGKIRSTDTAGVEGKYISADSLEGGGGSGTPSDTVVEETAFGQAADPGDSTEYSRGDHTHGTPPDPSGLFVEKDGDTMTGPLVTAASDVSGAGLSLQEGAMPTSPVDGDIIMTANGIFVRSKGHTFQIAD